MKLALVVAMAIHGGWYLPPCPNYGTSDITEIRASAELLCEYDGNGDIWGQIEYPSGVYWIPAVSLPIPKELQ